VFLEAFWKTLENMDDYIGRQFQSFLHARQKAGMKYTRCQAVCFITPLLVLCVDSFLSGRFVYGVSFFAMACVVSMWLDTEEWLSPREQRRCAMESRKVFGFLKIRLMCAMFFLGTLLGLPAAKQMQEAALTVLIMGLLVGGVYFSGCVPLGEDEKS